MTTTILRTLIYLLPATTLSYAECHSILSLVLKAGLPASGIARSFPRIIAHMPLMYNGLAIPHLYTEQGISHIFQILRHAHVPDSITGQLLRTSMQQVQLELGLPGNLFEVDYKSYHQLSTACWVTHTWKFCDEYSIIIKGPTPELSLHHKQDHFLIPSFFAAGFRKTELQMLNRCQLFLQVVTLADISTGDGTSITTSSWTGTYDSLRPHFFEWPRQGQPPNRDWNLWRKALTLTFGVHPTRHTVPLPLGPWLDSDDAWSWFYSHQEHRLYERSQRSWNVFSQRPGRASRAATSQFHAQPFPLESHHALPHDLLRTVVFMAGDVLRHSGTSRTGLVDIPPALPLSFSHFISQLAPDSKWAVEQFSSTDYGFTVAQAITNHSCIAVSDGSFKSDYGTASWVLEGPEPSGRIVGDTIVPGSAAAQCAYRSELTGLYSIAVMVHCLSTYYKITQGTMEIGCDGLEALHRACSTDFHPAPTDAHYDLIIATRSVMASCPIHWLYRHVKGHQDDDITKSLDRWALLNVEMDSRAKVHWIDTHSRSLTGVVLNEHIRGEPWAIWLGRSKISTNLRDSIINHIHGQDALQWWVSKNRIPEEEKLHIDWSSIKSAMTTSPLPRHH